MRQRNGCFSFLWGARLALAELAALDTSYDFALPDLSGKPVKLSEQRGKVVLLNFWATWCGPCRKELPMVNKLANEYRDQGLVILARVGNVRFVPTVALGWVLLAPSGPAVKFLPILRR